MKHSGRKYSVPIKVNRRAPDAPLKPFTEYFQGFERVGAVRSVFGDRTEEVLRGLRIGFIPNRRMYMGIRDNDGNLAVGTYHLKTSPERTLYLDIVHELFHVNQRMTNQKYFHDEFMKFMGDRALYYASPIEIPAYQHTVREAERIGMSRDEILEYLKMFDAPPKTWRAFVKRMDLKKGPTSGRRINKFPVKIKRDVSPKLYPFSDYLTGFEKLPAVRELFGESTNEVIGNLKVEFIDSPFQMIYPDEDDGHLIIASRYFQKESFDSIYLDVLFCLNLVKRASQAATSPSDESLMSSEAFVESSEALVKEARRLKMRNEEITPHLQMARFMMTPAEYEMFLKKIGLS